MSSKLIPKKRPVDPLMALARIPAERRPRGWCTSGQPAFRSELEHKASELGLSEQVFFLGFRNQTELPAIYGACDVLVLPSDFEPWGLVVNEAMACGMAVIASDQVGAVPDLVEGSVGSSRTSNIESLTQALEGFRLRKASGKLGRLRASESGIGAHRETVAGLLEGAEQARRRRA